MKTKIENIFVSFKEFTEGKEYLYLEEALKLAYGKGLKFLSEEDVEQVDQDSYRGKRVFILSEKGFHDTEDSRTRILRIEDGEIEEIEADNEEVLFDQKALFDGLETGFLFKV